MGTNSATAGIYPPIKGVDTPNTFPGSRIAAASWFADGYFWVFGGAVTGFAG